MAWQKVLDKKTEKSDQGNVLPSLTKGKLCEKNERKLRSCRWG